MKFICHGTNADLLLERLAWTTTSYKLSAIVITEDCILETTPLIHHLV